MLNTPEKHVCENTEGLQTQPAQKSAGAISTFHFIDPPLSLTVWCNKSFMKRNEV